MLYVEYFAEVGDKRTNVLRTKDTNPLPIGSRITLDRNDGLLFCNSSMTFVVVGQPHFKRLVGGDLLGVVELVDVEDYITSGEVCIEAISTQGDVQRTSFVVPHDSDQRGLWEATKGALFDAVERIARQDPTPVVAVVIRKMP